MINEKKLEQAGIDYNAGLLRFMNNKKLYEVILRSFINDNMLVVSKKAFDEGDTETLFRAVHEAKGSSGNVCLKELFDASSVLVDLLRSKDYTKKELEEKYYKFEAAYENAWNGVKCALED